MSIIDIDIVVTTSGEQASGKTLIIEVLRERLSYQPDVLMIDAHPGCHEVHIVGKWETDLDEELYDESK